MLLNLKHLVSLASFCLTGFIANAAPPGASVSVKLEVPVSLRKGSFNQDRYLNVPPNFQISLFALVPGARFLAVAPNGDVLVSTPGAGTITLLRPAAGGGAPASFTWASGLTSPHGIVFHKIGDTTYVYVSESTQIDRYVYSAGETSAHNRQVIITGLPASTGYAHPLKNIAVDSNDKLYVSIGSSCNVCTGDTTSNPVKASIYQYNADGSGGRLFAQGLRNAEGLAFLPGTQTLWIAGNNRDDIPYPIQDSTGNYGKVVPSYVDNHPPDLFTSVRDGGNYGWPFCNGNPDSPSGFNNMPFDRDMDTNPDEHVDCGAMDPVVKGIQAHSAPLGLTFLQRTNFAAAYRNGAVIGLHGSWDRSRRTGYKVVYYPFDPASGQPGDQVDLVTGWLDDSNQGVWGRPVGVAVDQQGGLLITDDAAGAIYRLAYVNPPVSDSANGYATVAPGSIASAYGSAFPTKDNLTLTVRDSAGTERPAGVLYSSPAQINFQVPAGTAAGQATVLANGTSVGTVAIAPVAPGLFSMSGDGTGVAAALAVRVVLATHEQSPVPVFSCQANVCTPVPIDLGVDTPVYLSLYGTGISPETDISKVKVTIGGVDVPVLYAGPQGQFPGLDQINVPLLLSLRGKGLVDVLVTVDGVTSNSVQIAIR